MDRHLMCPLGLPQVPEAAGTFELQIGLVHNEKGVLADGRCCRGGLDPPCPAGEQCRTFLRACLKEYQLRALPGGPCVLGVAATPVLGGNIFSAGPRKSTERGDRMVVPFDFAWPVRGLARWLARGRECVWGRDAAPVSPCVRTKMPTDPVACIVATSGF